MKTSSRRGFTQFDLIVVLAILGLLLGLLMPLLQLVRVQARNAESMNNLKQIALACHNYHDANNRFPSGNDKNNFSAHAYLLPYVEQDNLFRNINFNAASDGEANANIRQTRIKIFISPLDKAANEGKGAPTSYLFSAGSQYALEKNNGVCYQDSQIRIVAIVDGTSNTILTGETLVGHAVPKDPEGKLMGKPSVARQHVKLDKDALKKLKDESGVQDFADSKNIATDRGHSWMDGRFLQTTFTGTRTGNDSKPDVNCGGLGGLSALRNTGNQVLIGFCDGSVRTLSTNLNLQTWNHLTQRNDGQAVEIN